MSDIVNFLLKTNDVRYRGPNFGVWSASYASAKTWTVRGASHHLLIWAIIVQTFFSLSTK